MRMMRSQEIWAGTRWTRRRGVGAIAGDFLDAHAERPMPSIAMPAFLEELVDPTLPRFFQSLGPAEHCEKLFRRRHTVAVFDELRHFAPVDVDIEPHTNPSERALVRWYEESLGIRVNQHFLNAVGRVQPESHTAVIMVVVHEHREHLFSDSERGRTPGLFFGGLGEPEADLPHTLERLAGLGHGPGILVPGERRVECHV